MHGLWAPAHPVSVRAFRCKKQLLTLRAVDFSAEMGRVSAFSPVDLFADGEYASIQAVAAFFGIFVEAGFIFIELVIAAEFDIGDIGHEDIGSSESWHRGRRKVHP